ncbi:MAG: hypothetical protein Fur0035_08290 [Anaerolineales bacterium]
MPEFSVIIPSYNHAKYIKTAIESVLSQSLGDLELIVIDDGSSDNSLEIISQFTDPRLRLFRQPNQGAHEAINRGIRVAAGTYISILNSDDVYETSRLQKIKECFVANPNAGLVSSYINLIDSNGRLLGIKEGYKSANPWLLDLPEKSFRGGENLQKALLAENYIATTSNFAFLKKWFDAVGPFRPLRYAHDWDFALRIARQTSIHLIPEPLLNYRVHATNTIRENQSAMVFEICWCLAVHLPRYFVGDFALGLDSFSDVEQLLHSIYLFGVDKVLSIMLLQRLSENDDLSLALLDAGNPLRAKYVDFISRELNKNSPAPQPSSLRDSLSAWWNRLGK